jgi:hypothetical protein
MVKLSEMFSENTESFLVKHTLHFYVNGESIDYTISYKKASSEKFPKEIQINRTLFSLKKESFVFYFDELHLHAHYEAD